jgi:hypothetical protein
LAARAGVGRSRGRSVVRDQSPGVGQRGSVVESGSWLVRRFGFGGRGRHIAHLCSRSSFGSFQATRPAGCSRRSPGLLLRGCTDSLAHCVPLLVIVRCCCPQPRPWRRASRGSDVEEALEAADGAIWLPPRRRSSEPPRGGPACQADVVRDPQRGLTGRPGVGTASGQTRAARGSKQTSRRLRRQAVGTWRRRAWGTSPRLRERLSGLLRPRSGRPQVGFLRPVV